MQDEARDLTQSLPMGFRVRIRADVRTTDDSRTLVGGTPMRAIRLSAIARALVVDGEIEVRDETTSGLAERLIAADIASPVLAGPGCSADELTVVVPVRDRVAELEQVLAGLRPELKCIVVDDASEDRRAVADVVRRFGADLVPLPENLGPAGARNAGLRRVTTPYVAFVDSDITVEPDVLLRLGCHFEDPRVAMVAPLVRGHTSSGASKWFQKYDEINSSLDLGTRPAVVHPAGAVAWLPSACLVARTRCLAEGFDESMRVGEDVDLVWRLIDAGWRVRYDPRHEANHETRPTVRSWLGRKVAYGTGGAPLAERHGDLLAPAVLSPTYAAVAVALLAQRWWTLPVLLAAGAKAVHSVDRAIPSAPGTLPVVVLIVGQGFVWTARQEAALLLRHWWPMTAIAFPFSRRIRRAVLAATLLDLAFYWPHRARISPAKFVLARRLDDLAYGAGLWWGALSARSTKALRPRLVRR